MEEEKKLKKGLKVKFVRDARGYDEADFVNLNLFKFKKGEIYEVGKGITPNLAYVFVKEAKVYDGEKQMFTSQPIAEIVTSKVSKPKTEAKKVK
jgi:hypothetical protein